MRLLELWHFMYPGGGLQKGSRDFLREEETETIKLWQQLELASKLESDLTDTVDLVQSGWLISTFGKNQLVSLDD